jgi:endonuclease IV
MRLIFKSREDFEKWLRQSPTTARKLNRVSYTTCRSPRGVELVPVISTAHLHTIVVETPTTEDYEETIKLVARLLGLGEEDIPFCIVESSPT